MAGYELVVEAPERRLVFVAAHSDTGAVDMARETVRAEYAGVSDPKVLAARVTLLPGGGGRILLETTVADVLAT